MMKISRFWPFCGLLFLAGCANSPSGGPTSPNQAPNRLTVTLTTRQNLNADYYYGVAFDDNGNIGDGPRGIEGVTSIPNGVVGGNFRLLVLYRRNNFEVWRRGNPSDPATEERLLTSPFIGTPRATANSVNFTLDLDAKVDDSRFFFAHNGAGNLTADRFDINFVTTNTILREPTSGDIIKPVDAYGQRTVSTSFDFQIQAARRAEIRDDFSDDSEKDIDISPSFNNVNFGQLNVTRLFLEVARG